MPKTLTEALIDSIQTFQSAPELNGRAIEVLLTCSGVLEEARDEQKGQEILDSIDQQPINWLATTRFSYSMPNSSPGSSWVGETIIRHSLLSLAVAYAPHFFNEVLKRCKAFATKQNKLKQFAEQRSQALVIACAINESDIWHVLLQDHFFEYKAITDDLKIAASIEGRTFPYALFTAIERCSCLAVADEVKKLNQARLNIIVCEEYYNQSVRNPNINASLLFNEACNLDPSFVADHVAAKLHELNANSAGDSKLPLKDWVDSFLSSCNYASGASLDQRRARAQLFLDKLLPVILVNNPEAEQKEQSDTSNVGKLFSTQAKKLRYLETLADNIEDLGLDVAAIRSAIDLMKQGPERARALTEATAQAKAAEAKITGNAAMTLAADSPLRVGVIAANDIGKGPLDAPTPTAAAATAAPR